MLKTPIVSVVAAVTVLIGMAPATAQTARPALSQLDAEMRALYADVAAGTVRVHLPLPAVVRLMEPDYDWLNKWREQLDPRVLEQLEQRPGTRPIDVRAVAPGTEPAPGMTTAPRDSKTVMYLDEVADRMVAVLPRETGTGDFVGVVLGDGGHVAIPAHLTRDDLGTGSVRVTAGDEQVAATFVGSDRQTNVTVLKLAKPFGKPLAFADEKPALWTGGHEDHAVVIDLDGRIAGFARPGQVLAGPDLRFVVGEIIKHGKVRRALLGALIGQVQPNDPIRQQVPVLGARPALRVSMVAPRSAAEAGGLKPDDLILSLAGEPVENLPTFAAAISSHSGPTELKIIRNGQEATVTVNLELR
jgi:S1-C subfamily serine protease